MGLTFVNPLISLIIEVELKGVNPLFDLIGYMARGIFFILKE